MATLAQRRADYRYAKIAKKHGMQNALRIAWEARSLGINTALAYAMVEQETGNGKNVWGHDPTRSIPDHWKGTLVTEGGYLAYKKLRKAGYGMQGVGPLQLTWWATQDQADRLGGCWVPKYNIRQGFMTLRGLMKAYGAWDGVRRYNGSGPAAVHYRESVRSLFNKWHKRLYGA